MRRFFVPEAIQSSSMDCGTASLKALLEGFGIRASYGRLREACQTDVDGTSIDQIEEAALAAGAMALAAAGTVMEALLLRGLFDLGRELATTGQRAAAIAALLVFSAALLAVDFRAASLTLRIGRRLEARMRIAFLAKIPRLNDCYFQSRPVSDMAERCHNVQQLRQAPEMASLFLRNLFGIVFTVAGIGWLYPESLWPAGGLAAIALIVPLLAQPALAERDLRLRSHSGALTRYYLDALLGLTAIRAHAAERAVRREQLGVLREWARAGFALQRAAVAVEGVQFTLSLAVAIGLVWTRLAHGGEVGGMLLLVYWVPSLPAMGDEAATAVWQYPLLRSTALRLLEPLGAPEEPRVEAAPSAHATAAEVVLDGATVHAAGITILDGISVRVSAGEHVGIVGVSGAGKSSLVGLLLGWHRPAAGSVLVDGEPLGPEALDRLRRSTALPGWMEAAAATFGMETEAVEVWGFRAEYLLRTSAPALVPVAGGWAGLLDVRRGRAWLLAPDLSRKAVPLADLVRAMCTQPAEPFQAGIAKLVDECGIVPRRRQRAIEALAREKLRYTRVTTAWPLRTAPGASFRRQLSDAGVLRKAALLAGAHGVEYLLWIGAWYILGRDTLAGRLDAGWLAAWGLALATVVPCRLLTTWLQGAVAISGGGLLRQRLLDGALRLTSQEVRHEGAGRFLGRAIETELIESLALSGGMLPVLATLELCFSAPVLLAGAAPASHALALALAVGAAVTLAWRYFRRRADWTAARLAMTHDLVERMTGHRTRLAQEPPEEWHPPEDRAVAQCLELAAAMDRENARLTGALPRAWLLAGIAALTPAFLGARPDTTVMAVSLGGLLLAWQAFRRLAAGLANLAGAAISWRQVAPLFEASARGRDERAPAAETSSTGNTVVDAKDLAFAYEGRATRVLDGIDLRIRRGEWLLLEGESGGGKSTLVSVLTGLRAADS